MAKKIFSKFIFTPLSTSLSIDVADGVPSVQTEDSVGNLSPDYALTPLTLRPRLSVLDPDTGESTPDAMSGVASLKWEEVSGTATTEITASTPGYSLTTAGDGRGTLRLTRNLAQSGSVVLRLTVILYDPRTGQSVKRVATHKVSRRNSASARPRLRLDVPRSLAYHPLRDPADLVVTPSLTGGGRDWKPPVNCGFIYEKWEPQSRTWRRVLCPGDSGYDVMDYDVMVSADTSRVTIHRDMMGPSLRIRCRAWYLDPQTGVPVGATSQSYDGIAPSDEVFLERRLPLLTEDILNVGWRMGNGTRRLMPKAVVSDTSVIPDPSRELDISWRAGMAGSLRSVGSGEQVSIDVPLAEEGSFEIEVTATDRGSWCAATDADGTVLTDSDGTVLLIR